MMNFSHVHHEGNLCAPKRSKCYAFDVNQQAESLVRWEQRYNQHSKGRFNGYLDELKLGGMHLFEEFTSQTLIQQCCVNEDSVWIGFSLQSQRPKINGTQIAENQLMIRPSGVEFELLTPQAFHIFGLVIDKGTIAQQLTDMDSELWLNPSSNILITEPSAYVGYELAKLIQLMLSERGPLPGTLTQDAYRTRVARLQPLVASRIADLLSQTESGMSELASRKPGKRRIVEGIQRQIAETGHYPLTISELCQMAYVSRRTLQYAFEQELGVSPIQYLRDCRLNEVRRQLLTAPADTVISNVAMDYGFYHISTFIEHYKQLFGEAPSQTLKHRSAYQSSSMKIR